MNSRIHVFFDPGHGAKRKAGGVLWDPGAMADINGDGVIEAAETEAHQLRLLAPEVAGRLDALEGLSAEVIPDTFDAADYSDSHRYASEQAHARGHICVYLALHFNAAASGLVRRGLVAHYKESALSRRAARQMASAWTAMLVPTDLITSAQAVAVAADSTQDSYRRMHYCIRHVGYFHRGGRVVPVPNIAALCLEPCDLRLVGDRMPAVADAIAYGIVALQRELETL